MRCYLIRHGATAGNAEKRYIGRTDEPLSDSGRSALAVRRAPEAELLLVSPLKRCRETAEILYPGRKFRTVEAFRECDFGDFEGKNYLDLTGRADYQAWIDSGGKSAFPNGEVPEEFVARSSSAFFKEISSAESSGVTSLCILAHNGTVMSILYDYASEKKDYYDWSVPNGDGYAAEWTGKELRVLGRIWEEPWKF